MRSNHLPQPAGNPLPRATHEAGGHFGHNGTLLAHGQLGVQQDTQSLFWKTLCRLSAPGLSWCLRLFLAKSRTPHFPLLSFIPDQPIYPASKDPSEQWHNHLVYQQLLPVLYSRAERKFRWNSTAHRSVSQHSQTNKPSSFNSRKLSQCRLS